MPVQPVTKICVDCRKSFEAVEPYKQDRCEDCQREHSRELNKGYYENRKKEWHASDYAANPEKYRERNKRYYEQNKLKIAQQKAERYQENLPMFRETLTANRAVVVIYDPLPIEDGGFTPGYTMFPYEDLPFMLNTGAFTNGTVIEKKGARFVVRDRQLEPTPCPA